MHEGLKWSEILWMSRVVAVAILITVFDWKWAKHFLNL